MMGAAMLVCRVQAQTCTHATASAATAYSGSGADEIHAMAPAWYHRTATRSSCCCLILKTRGQTGANAGQRDQMVLIAYQLTHDQCNRTDTGEL